MEEIEELWWAKRQLGEQTKGKRRLITRTGGYLFVEVGDNCLAVCYFAMVRNQKAGQHRADVKGHLWIFSGYCNEARLKQLSEEISGLSVLVRELEAAQLNVSEEELQELIRESGQQDGTVEGAERKA